MTDLHIAAPHRIILTTGAIPIQPSTDLGHPVIRAIPVPINLEHPEIPILVSAPIDLGHPAIPAPAPLEVHRIPPPGIPEAITANPIETI
jgi:hypothetical protein